MKKTISERFTKIRFDDESSGQRQLEVAELLCGAEKPNRSLLFLLLVAMIFKKAIHHSIGVVFEDGSSIQCSSLVDAESSFKLMLLVKCSR